MEEDSNFDSSTVSFCPSFSTYTSPILVDIANKVTQERDDNGDVEEEDFEFVSLGDGDGDGDACQILIDGQIRQVFPVFNRDLMFNNGDGDDGEGSGVENLLVPLRNLFMEDQGDGPPSSSSSSSEADELEGLPEETYCVWAPNTDPHGPSSNKCKKSKSTGSSSSSSSSSSKGWFKLRHLLKRSNSDGTEPFIFLQKAGINAESKPKQGSSKGEVKTAGSKLKVVSAHEAFYVKNRAVKQGDKKKSYLPYRQDLVGIFTSNYVNSLSLGKTFPPF